MDKPCCTANIYGEGLIFREGGRGGDREGGGGEEVYSHPVDTVKDKPY